MAAATLSAIVDDLAEAYVRRAWHEGRRIRTEVTTVHQELAQGVSVAQAQREADWASLEDRLAVVELDGRIAALTLRLAHDTAGS